MTMNRPIVLVDMDGVIADFDAAFFAYCEAQGYEMDCTLETQTKRFATDHIVDPLHRRYARHHVDTTDWFRHLPVVKGALEGLQQLEQYADIWIVSKPLEANPTGRDDKAAWIGENLGRWWVKRLILAPDKSLIRGNILLDDAPHPEWYERATWKPVIFPSPWNGKGSKWERIFRWKWGDPINDLLTVGLGPL